MVYRVTVSGTLRARIPVKLLRDACLRTLKYERTPSAQIEILVVGKVAMQSLNRKYLQHDYVTDVLSFHLGATPGSKLFGQIVICKVFAEKESRKHGVSINEELTRYVIHGTLHLLGYDDSTERARAKMWKVQERHVSKTFR